MKKKIIKSILVGLVLFTVIGAAIIYFAKIEIDDMFYIVSEEEDREFKVLSDGYEENLWGDPDIVAADKIATELKSSIEGSYFENVNYDDDNRAGWQTIKHLSNLFVMIKNYGKELIAINESVQALLVDTLDFWLNKDFQSPNWWHNRIATPQILADIGIMLKPYLSESQISLIKAIIMRGSLSYYNGTRKWTGANMLDAIDTTVKYAFLVNEANLLKKAVAFAEKEIFVSDGDTEGIKMDYSFYQHGAQQAIMSYGLVYVKLLAELAELLDGTSFQLSEEKFGVMVDFILNGQRYAFRGNRSNYLTNGRSYSRKSGSNARGIKSAIGILLSIKETPKKEELQKVYNSFNNHSFAPEEAKYFPYSHTLFDVSPNYYMAVKGAYKGFRNSELVNSENVLARNLGYGGVTTYQYSGYEYDDISALWDFSMLPGTTAFNETDEMLADYPKNAKNGVYQSKTTHSDGNADGVAGGLFVDIENEDGLFSRQAYISYKGLMVCLGNSITCSDSSNTRQIFTTINQVYAENATYKGNIIQGTRTIDDNSIVNNGAFAYYNLGGGNLTAKVAII